MTKDLEILLYKQNLYFQQGINFYVCLSCEAGTFNQHIYERHNFLYHNNGKKDVKH